MRLLTNSKLTTPPPTSWKLARAHWVHIGRWSSSNLALWVKRIIYKNILNTFFSIFEFKSKEQKNLEYINRNNTYITQLVSNSQKNIQSIFLHWSNVDKMQLCNFANVSYTWKRKYAPNTPNIHLQMPNYFCITAKVVKSIIIFFGLLLPLCVVRKLPKDFLKANLRP